MHIKIIITVKLTNLPTNMPFLKLLNPNFIKVSKNLKVKLEHFGLFTDFYGGSVLRNGILGISLK
jgi:hypothetical protein